MTRRLPEENRETGGEEGRGMKSRKKNLGEECFKFLAPKLSIRRAVKIQTRQKQTETRNCDSSKLWHHQTKMSGIQNVKHKDSSEIAQLTAVPARRSALVPIGSPLSL